LDTFINKDNKTTEEAITINKMVQYFERLMHISCEDTDIFKNNIYAMLKKISTQISHQRKNLIIL